MQPPLTCRSASLPAAIFTLGWSSNPFPFETLHTREAQSSNAHPPALVRHIFDLPLPSVVLNTRCWIAALAQHKTPIQALLLRHSVKSVDGSSCRAGSAADEHRPSPCVAVGDRPRFSRSMLRALCKSEQRHTAKREREGEAQLRRVQVRARACSRRSPAAPLPVQSPSLCSVDRPTLFHHPPSTSARRSPPKRTRL